MKIIKILPYDLFELELEKKTLLLDIGFNILSNFTLCGLLISRVFSVHLCGYWRIMMVATYDCQKCHTSEFCCLLHGSLIY